jgi:hypothetical protein
MWARKLPSLNKTELFFRGVVTNIFNNAARTRGDIGINTRINKATYAPRPHRVARTIDCRLSPRQAARATASAVIFGSRAQAIPFFSGTSDRSPADMFLPTHDFRVEHKNGVQPATINGVTTVASVTAQSVRSRAPARVDLRGAPVERVPTP